MPRPKPHYRVLVTNLATKERLHVELIDLPFVSGRSFRLRINRKWALKVPVGSKTTVLRQLQSWWVSH